LKSINHIIACIITVLIFVGTCLIFIASCNSHSTSKCAPCPLALRMPPNITFRVVDKATGKDLFFGSAAQYATSQLKVHHILNGHIDTAYLHIDNLNKDFNVRINTVHQVDTVTVNIADKPQDILLFKSTTTGGCCSTTYLSSVTFNGTVVYTQKQGPDVVAILAK
jgi:hypothetical protein